MDSKHWLYFGLGTLATIPFGLRSLVQWFVSEYHKKSHVTLSFWVLSTIGNILMLCHYLAQIQYHLFFIRLFPFYFAIRQILLIKKRSAAFSIPKAAAHFLILFIGLSLLFAARVFWQHEQFFWITNPMMPWQKAATNVHMLWHIFGFLGAALFMSRMWVQWWQSEQAKQSYLSTSFWWISLIGASMTLTYALVIQDLITALGYCLGIIPYIRNLLLIKRSKQARVQ